MGLLAKAYYYNVRDGRRVNTPLMRRAVEHELPIGVSRSRFLRRRSRARIDLLAGVTKSRLPGGSKRTISPPCRTPRTVTPRLTRHYYVECPLSIFERTI